MLNGGLDAGEGLVDGTWTAADDGAGVLGVLRGCRGAAVGLRVAELQRRRHEGAPAAEAARTSAQHFRHGDCCKLD